MPARVARRAERAIASTEIASDEIGAPLADHDRRRIGIARDELGHHRGIGDVEPVDPAHAQARRSEEHTSELQSLMRISYAVFCLKQNKILAKETHRQDILN